MASSKYIYHCLLFSAIHVFILRQFYTMYFGYISPPNLLPSPILYSPTLFHPALKLLLVFSFLIDPIESGLCWCVINLSRIVSLNSLPSLLATIKRQQLSVSGGILHAPALYLNLFWLQLVHDTCLCLFVCAFCVFSFPYYYHILKIFTYTIDFY